jgi:hypothetical protein
MATKTGLTTAIANAITVLITRAKLLSGLTEIVNEIYPDVASDSNVSETYTTKAGTTFDYDITITKVGRTVTMRGNFTNTTFSMQNPQNIFTFKNNQFKPRNENVRVEAFTQNSNTPITLFLNSNVLATVGTASLAVYYFNITYSTLD